MSWHREYKEQWKEIIETVAAEEHRTTQMVEKDTIQSMILSGISQSDLPFVFKGGTSLSKAYGLIDRFSEDIDLSMNRKPTEGEKKQTKNLILSLAEDLGLFINRWCHAIVFLENLNEIIAVGISYILSNSCYRQIAGF